MVPVLSSDKSSTLQHAGPHHAPLMQGILAADLTLTEVKSLSAIQRLPAIRDPNYDGRYRVITLQEHIDLVKVSCRLPGCIRPVQIRSAPGRGTQSWHACPYRAACSHMYQLTLFRRVQGNPDRVVGIYPESK